MESEDSGKSMNPRTLIDNRLGLIKEDLDGVEKRLVVIIEELLGPQPVPEDRAREEEKIKTKARGWLGQVVSRLDDFRDQLGRIKGLERGLKNSMIGSSKNMLEEQKESSEGR